MAVTECIVLKEYGVVRLNAAIAAAVSNGFTPQPGLMAGEGSWFMMVMKKDPAVTVTSCVVKVISGVERLGQEITSALAGGLVPFGNIEPIGSDDYGVVFVAGASSGGGSVSVDDITGATTTGKALMKAADAAAARTAIGAGTGNSNLVIGTSSTQAKAGNYQPTVANISDAGAFGRQLLQAADQAAAKTLLGIS
ncbi:TPA: FMN-binding protein [Serratia marcescens]|nr:FMN-binding protein [Serratia marcescens]